VTTIKTALKTIPNTPQWANHHVERTLEAYKIQMALLRNFGHTSQLDISNQFLAPARLLMQGMASTGTPISPKTVANWEMIWKDFETAVLKHANICYGYIGQEIYTAAKPITAWFAERTRAPTLAYDLERMMALLTSCRVLSGERTHVHGDNTIATRALRAVSHKSNDNKFKILIVDDHADYWKPVFAIVCKGLNVDINYSTGEDEESIHWGHYDLVILDVFIGSKDGRDILNTIRRDFGHLPVLLWTTSRDDEITSKASLANGILLKKTVTFDVLRNTIEKWMEAGAAKKSFSLPNPFFDHVIANPEYRELANKCNEWCLTQLDSFHALDGEFFRYFADHGGRHILKVLELLEHALTPFLSGTPDLFSKDRDQRQFEVFSLYLAILCHELGMFPMKQGVKSIGRYDNVSCIEDFSSLGRDYLADVRSLHALRAMALLQSDSGSYWSDTRGNELGLELRNKNFLLPGSDKFHVADAVAVLIGYHARCLKSLKKEYFLNWKNAWEKIDVEKKPCDVQERFSKLRSSVVTLSKTQSAFEAALNALSSKLDNQEYRQRLRKQCALLRFVDAIDVSQSRNPAHFLVLGKGRNAKNNVEFLKRQVCENISISSTDRCALVNVTLNSPKPTNRDRQTVKKALSSVGNKSFGNKSLIMFSFIKNPWADKSRDSSKTIQKDLDKWLENTWEVIMGVNTNPEFIKHLKNIGVFESHPMASTAKITPKGKKVIAMITALSVAGEVLDEYGAIQDAEITDQIRLGDLIFTWDGIDAPENITLLREGLAQYAAGQ
jgi:CheY-like chemotaxis protein